MFEYLAYIQYMYIKIFKNNYFLLVRENIFDYKHFDIPNNDIFIIDIYFTFH